MKLDQAQRLMQTLEIIDPALNVQQLRVLLYCMERLSKGEDEVPMQDVIKDNDLTKAAASRIAAYMGKRKASRIPGLNLLERVEDPEDTRLRNIRLTKRGHLVLQSIQEL